MYSFIIGKIGRWIVTVFLLLLGTFGLLLLVPDAVNESEFSHLALEEKEVLPSFYFSLLDPKNDPEKMEASDFVPVMQWHGTNNTFHNWFGKIVQGDLGISNQYNKPVLELIKEAFSWTFLLGILTTVLSLVCIPLALFSFTGKLQLNWFLRGAMIVPKFVWALLFFTICTASFIGMDPLIFSSIQRGWSSAYYWFLIPAICMVLPSLGYLTDQLLVQLEEEFKKDYAQTALAKGLSRKEVVKKHVLKNSLFPMVTIMTHLVPGYLVGSVLVERIFGLPGMGNLLIEAMLNRDFNLILGLALFSGLVVSFVYFIGDLLYTIIHPKLKWEDA